MAHVMAGGFSSLRLTLPHWSTTRPWKSRQTFHGGQRDSPCTISSSRQFSRLRQPKQPRWRGPQCAKAAASKTDRSQGKKSGVGFKSGCGFGAQATPKAGQASDPAALLRRSERLFDELLSSAVDMEERLVRLYVVVARRKGGGESGDGVRHDVLSDWLPVAELVLLSEDEGEVVLRAAVPLMIKQIGECVNRAAPSFRKIHRSTLEYAVEGWEDFQKHVLDNLDGPSFELDPVECPYATLGLKRGASAVEVKTAYRALAAVHHPDRNSGANYVNAHAMFLKVTTAYQDIKRFGDHAAPSISNYASFGGSAARDLIGPISPSLTKAPPLRPGTEVAVRPLDPDFVSQFMLKAQARGRKRAAAV